MPTISALNRLMAALCVALIMVYAATMPVKAANQIQHNLPAMIAHQHDTLDVVSIEAVHEDSAGQSDHHKDDPDSQDRSGEDMAGGHHHHGDSGSSLLVPGAALTTASAPLASLPGMGKVRAMAGLRSIEPERPPRQAALIA